MATALPSNAATVVRAGRQRRPAVTSLDDLVGAEQDRLWNIEPKILCSLEINDKLDLRWLLDWQVSRLGAAQEFVHIAGCSAPSIHQVGGIGDQASILDIRLQVIHRRQSTFGSQFCHMRAPCKQ